MKTLKRFALVIALVAIVSHTEAADPALPAPDKPVPKAGSDHIALDGFASYRPNSGRFGEGVGLSYFANRYVGLGAEAQFDGLDRGRFPLDVNLAGNVILRTPAPVLNLRPYVFGGGGRPIGRSDWEVHLGGGTQFRLAKYANLFVDWRFIEDPRAFHLDNGLLKNQMFRAGLNFSF